TNIKTLRVSFLGDISDQLPAHFDRILIDTPCSNSGVLARRPEARYHQDDQSLRSLAKLQFDILTDTAPRLAPSGLLLYSTCSIWPDENQSSIDHFLSTHPDFHKLSEQTTLPSTDPEPRHYHAGGYF